MKAWLKRLFENKSKIFLDQSASATLYPKKIVIQTMNKGDGGILHGSSEIFLLANDVTDKELGEIVLKSLSKSIYSPINFKYVQESRLENLKFMKFKSEKEAMTNALRVTVFRTNEILKMAPRENKFSDGRQRMYYGMPGSEITIDSNSEAVIIGKILREAWDKCVIT
jgi:hypothetical protein